jgi:alkaline phosphatase
VTDSAAAATALACGEPTANGFIGVDPKGRPLTTCLEDARDAGLRTGLVTTTRITHATPACFASHVPNRTFEVEIARQMFASNGPDVLLGGGAAVLDQVPQGASQTLSRQASAAGYTVTTDWNAAQASRPKSGRLLGLFAPSHLPFLVDRDAPGEGRSPTLTEMTAKALELLAASDKGFFLMVEGGRIDHGGHANDVASVLGEMREFDETVALVRAFLAEHRDTLLVVTADHETGGLCLTYGARATTAALIASIGEAKGSAGSQSDDPRVHVETPESFGVGREGFYNDRRSWDASASALARSSWRTILGSIAE